MRVKDRRHDGKVHHVITPDLWGRLPNWQYDLPQEAVRAFIRNGTPQWLALDDAENSKKLSRLEGGGGTENNGKSNHHHGGSLGKLEQSIRKRINAPFPPSPVRGRGANNNKILAPSGAGASAVEEGDHPLHHRVSQFKRPRSSDAAVMENIRGMPLIDLTDPDTLELPQIHFRESLQKASLTKEQINALEANQELARCTYNLQTLSEQIRDIVLSLSPQKSYRDIAQLIHKASLTYVLLFERMVTELIRLSHDKTHDIATELSKQIHDLTQENQQLSKTVASLEAEVSLRDIQTQQSESLAILHKAQMTEFNILRERCQELEKINAIWCKNTMDGRKWTEESKRRKIALEKVLRNKELQIQRMYAMDNSRLEHRLEEIVYEETRQIAMDEAAKRRRQQALEMEKIRDRKFQSRGVQTTVDCDGSWDIQDGWPMGLSTSTKARLLWRHLMRFASCPACHGVKPFLRLAQEEERVKTLSQLSLELVGRGNDVDDGWWVSDDMARFISHLPKSMEATSIKDDKWLYSELWNLLQEKMMVAEEEHDFMDFFDFLCQEYLRQSRNRIEAEGRMFVLLRGLKTYRCSIPLVHLMARFLHLIDEASPAKTQERLMMLLEKNSEEQYDNDSGGSQHTISSHQTASATAKEKAGDRIWSSNTKLDKRFFLVYLHLRRAILCRTHDFVPPLNHRRIAGAEGRGLHQPPSYLTFHVGGLDAWVPLELVYDALAHSILPLLSSKRVPALNKWIDEHSFVLGPNGEVLASEGGKGYRNNVSVRRVIRQSLRKMAQSDSSDLAYADEGDKEGEREAGVLNDTHASTVGNYDTMTASSMSPTNTAGTQVLISLDGILEYIMDLLLDRELEMEKRVKEFCSHADSNGDGAITYDEFLAVAQKIEPTTPIHTINKMFCEAYKDTQYFTINEDTFVGVCKRFGLLRLVDLPGLRSYIKNHTMAFPANTAHNTATGSRRLKNIFLSSLSARKTINRLRRGVETLSGSIQQQHRRPLKTSAERQYPAYSLVNPRSPSNAGRPSLCINTNPVTSPSSSGCSDGLLPPSPSLSDYLTTSTHTATVKSPLSSPSYSLSYQQTYVSSPTGSNSSTSLYSSLRGGTLGSSTNHQQHQLSPHHTSFEGGMMGFERGLLGTSISLTSAGDPKPARSRLRNVARTIGGIVGALSPSSSSSAGKDGFSTNDATAAKNATKDIDVELARTPITTGVSLPSILLLSSSGSSIDVVADDRIKPAVVESSFDSSSNAKIVNDNDEEG